MIEDNKIDEDIEGIWIELHKSNIEPMQNVPNQRM